MEAERYRRMDSIFEAALDLPVEERDAFLATACGNDDELRQAIERLIELDGEAADFMSQPLKPPPDLSGEPELEDHSERRLGPYLLLRRLGHGGMGAIYLAERQDEYHQQVAVKIMHRGFVSEEMQLRFRTERQALARLEHPNIARLYDGGTSEDGLPYLVMELIDGSPIDRYCDRQRLSLARRLRLFQKLCSGVDHAHRNLLVHRDIKPTNVLVTAAGTPKLLDFGIAKLLGPIRLGDDGEETDMRPMTPGYASPEQVLGEAITTASDVYSLGVLLYELLSGRRPYRMTGEIPILEVHRSVCFDTPSPPSQRVLEETDAKGRKISAEDLARQRGTTPLDLQRRLRGDLDHIVMKAMSKEIEDRYPSAEDLARDIENYFAGRPVEATEGHWTYLASKFLQRHLLAAITAAVVVLLLGGSFLAVGKQARVAAEERNKAQAVTQFLLELFEVSSPDGSVSDRFTADQLIDLGTERMRRETADEEPQTRATLLHSMGQIQNLIGRQEEAKELLEEALDAYAADGSVSLPQQVQVLILLADIAASRRQTERAESLYDEAWALRRSKGPVRAEDQALAAIWQGQAEVRRQRGDLQGAEQLLRQSLQLHRELDGDSPSRQRARCRHLLAKLLHQTGDSDDSDEAVEHYEASLEMLRRSLGDQHPETMDVLQDLATLHLERGELDGFVRWQQQVIDSNQRFWGAEHPRTRASRERLAEGRRTSQEATVGQ